VLDIILYVYVISSSFEIFCSISDEKGGEIITHRKKKSDFVKGQNNSNLQTTYLTRIQARLDLVNNFTSGYNRKWHTTYLNLCSIRFINKTFEMSFSVSQKHTLFPRKAVTVKNSIFILRILRQTQVQCAQNTDSFMLIQVVYTLPTVLSSVKLVMFSSMFGKHNKSIQ